ncbi:WASL family protein [Megaselia abdita]
MNRAMREPSAGGAGGERTKISKPSQILSQEENELIFTLLGRKCQSLSTAVVQIFKTEGAAHSHWKKKHTAVLCFVKDSSKRSYFLRAYCLVKNEKCWEHEVYDGMKLSKSRPYLITFEGQDGNIALNFASPDECEEFYSKADTIIETRNRKKQDRRNRPKSTIAPLKPQAPSVDQADDSKVILRNNPNNINSITFNQNAPLPQPVQKTNIFGLTKKDKKKKKSKEKIISKTDISGPTNFMHIQHVGWDAQKGFDLNLNEEADEDLKTFFNKAGVSENELKDRETREFIYDFIHTNNVLKPKATPEVKPPPPVPTRHQHTQREQVQHRTAPPPPPAVGRQPPPPIPTTAVPTRAPPTRPPPIQVSSPPPAPMAPPPPPPPPPPMAPPPPPMPTAIASEGLKPPGPALPVQTDLRSELMESIRKGAQLKVRDFTVLKKYFLKTFKF